MAPAEPTSAPDEATNPTRAVDDRDEVVDLDEAADPAIDERIGTWRERMTRRSRD